MRAKVEHAIGVVKRLFGFTKVRYRGPAKNADRPFVTCALANLFMARHHLMRARAWRVQHSANLPQTVKSPDFFTA